ncbi:hypothetical protein HNQ91_002022 [Filimonas zeae]|uniref:Uncharacterized protein n=1 Tax=Filimonas zeae TaxID=1737353 RepID=A0A917IWA4_9BACT|nr:hypothetical protein [Filimonas zeae]MDR6338971.1 hypothetical protein [Filimonas zeae]GGH65718.1 hypothetical protein GCM10011379_19150 [Filimonas zeae]
MTKPAALFTLDSLNTRYMPPLEQAQLAEELIFLLRQEKLLAEHEQQAGAGAPAIPEEWMDYSEVDALIKVLKTTVTPPGEEAVNYVPLQKKQHSHFTPGQLALRLLIAVAAILIMWLFWRYLELTH